MVHFVVVNLATPNALIRRSPIQALRSADADARMGAVEGLRLSNAGHDPELFAPLAAMLRDPVPGQARKWLANLGDQEAQAIWHGPEAPGVIAEMMFGRSRWYSECSLS